MFISISVLLGGQSFDINVDDRQMIVAVAEILRERGLYRDETEISFFRSAMRDELVSGHSTFLEAGILNGDQLQAV